MPNTVFYIHFRLKSDTLFGSAERSEPGIDMDVQHDHSGYPFLAGRTLKGVLREQCANILDHLDQMQKRQDWEKRAVRLFGKAGEGLSSEEMESDHLILRFEGAKLPRSLREELSELASAVGVSADEMLQAMTTTRSQTAMQGWNGVAREKSLRTERVILRQTEFEARLQFLQEPEEDDMALLAACLKALRRCGSNRNRGSGELFDVGLRDTDGEECLMQHFKRFVDVVGGAT